MNPKELISFRNLLWLCGLMFQLWFQIAGGSTSGFISVVIASGTCPSQFGLVFNISVLARASMSVIDVTPSAFAICSTKAHVYAPLVADPPDTVDMSNRV